MARSDSASKLLAEWFWTDRWMGSSGFLLPMEPRGLYREMLTQAWNRGARLPNSPEAIRRATGCSADEWTRCWPQVQPYWEVDGAFIVNRTQQEIYAEARAKAEAASNRGRAGAEAKKRKAQGQQPDTPALEQHLSSAQGVLEHKPLSLSPSVVHTRTKQPSAAENVPTPDEPTTYAVEKPVESGRACGKPDNGAAYSGKVLRVPRFLDDEFVRRLNGAAYDLTGFYERLDRHLQQSGEVWDTRWIREQFAQATPQPERRSFAAEREPDRREVERFDEWRRKMGGCQHADRCSTRAECLGKYVRRLRGLREDRALT